MKILYRKYPHHKNSPTRARITVSKGAIGNRTATLNSSIWSRSTMNEREMKFFSYRNSFCFHFNGLWRAPASGQTMTMNERDEDLCRVRKHTKYHPIKHQSLSKGVYICHFDEHSRAFIFISFRCCPSSSSTRRLQYTRCKVWKKKLRFCSNIATPTKRPESSLHCS